MRTLFFYDFRRSSLPTTSLAEDAIVSLPGNGLVSTPLEQADATGDLQRTSPRFAVPDGFSSSVWSNIVKRKIDFLWVAISVGLAFFTWQHAVREAYSPIWLYVVLNI